MKERLDCKKAEPVYTERGQLQCKWCGRAVKWTHGGKAQHRRGYHRRFPDPRKQK